MHRAQPVARRSGSHRPGRRPIMRPMNASRHLLAVLISMVCAGCSSSDSTRAVGADGAAPDGEREASPDSAAESNAPDATPCKLTKPYATKNATCDECAEQNCCEPINVCYADLECDDTYVNCILACSLMPDPDAGDAGIAACMDDCAAQAPKGKLEYEAATGCADSKCLQQCQ